MRYVLLLRGINVGGKKTRQEKMFCFSRKILTKQKFLNL